jgi:hypothetical protein
MKKNLSKLERVPLREAWNHEAAEFTPWLNESENRNSLSYSSAVSVWVLAAAHLEAAGASWTSCARAPAGALS